MCNFLLENLVYIINFFIFAITKEGYTPTNQIINY